MKLFIFLLILIPNLACSQAVFEKKTFSRDGSTLNYRIMYPENYSAQKKYPVLLFLHGSGERGSDNEAQLKHGGSLFLNDTSRREFPAIVIFPQCPNDSAWSRISSRPDSTSLSGRRIDLRFQSTPTTPAKLAKLLLDSLITSNLADPKKMYVGGLSLGGFGTFDMIERYPDFFAAAVPICGGGDTTTADRFARKTSVWIFHGDADKSVDVKNSREYFAALKKRNADVKYTEYPGVGHNSWDNAFQDKTLLPWLISKSRK
ncbi:MAG: prolyl oligopeptidase family serine peptidase [Chitinophagaceae bacterium]